MNAILPGVFFVLFLFGFVLAWKWHAAQQDDSHFIIAPWTLGCPFVGMLMSGFAFFLELLQ